MSLKKSSGRPRAMLIRSSYNKNMRVILRLNFRRETRSQQLKQQKALS